MHKVFRVLLALKGFKVPLEHRVLLEHKVFKVLLEHRVFKVPLASLDLQ